MALNKFSGRPTPKVCDVQYLGHNCFQGVGFPIRPSALVFALDEGMLGLAPEQRCNSAWIYSRLNLYLTVANKMISNYITSVEVENGAIHVDFGFNSPQPMYGKVLAPVQSL